jgi:hypothetical protein
MIEYSEGFWITLSGLIIGFLGLSIRMCLKSKCDEVNLCYCIQIHRAVEVEEKIEEVELDHGIYDKDNSNKI